MQAFSGPNGTRRTALAALLGLAVLAFASRPIGPGAFAGGANALAFEDRAGLPLGTVLGRDGEHAVRVPLERVSPRFLAAIVATEDARFARHDGVDPLALGRAAWQLARSGEIVSGGSTITMQLARLRFGLPRTPLGKLEELVLARRIEAGTPKPAILAAYVNRLPMGGDLVGVEAGARTYFGVPARELDLAQAALLAALPNDPVRLDPYAHRAALEARRRAVLARMVATGAARADDAARAAAERVALLPRGEGIIAAPHLLFRLAGSVPPGATRVRTTLDRGLQTFAENETAHVVAALGERGARDGAALVLDNRDGAVLAYVGLGRLLRPRRGGQERRRHGAAPAGLGAQAVPLRAGLRAAHGAADDDPGRRAGGLRDPRPAGLPPERLQPALRRPGARAHRAGGLAQRPRGARPQRARRAGVPGPAARAGLPAPDARRGRLRPGPRARRRRGDARGARRCVRGGGQRRAARAGARAGGRARRRIPSGACGRIGSHGLAGMTSADETARVGVGSEWGLVTDILADAHARARAFGVASLLRTPFASAVKTGTSSDFRDTWTVGYTRDYTVATWVGNFDGTPMQHVSGVTGAAPLWNRIVRHLAERAVPAPFAPPRGYVRRPLCATTGVRPTRGCASVVGEWLDAGDLVAWNAPPRPLDRGYDGWLAAQPARAGEALRIVAPHDGDVYEAAPGARIAVVARGAARPAWELNGKPLAAHDARWTLPLARGRWTLRARDGAHIDTVTFTVGDPLPHGRRAGFSVR